MTNKMTYAQAIDNAIAMFTQGGQIDAEDYATVERLEALKASLAKRNSAKRGLTKTQKENLEVVERIYAVLTNEGKQCKSVAEEVGISTQKCSALLKQLVAAERAVRTVEKGKSYFTKVEG